MRLRSARRWAALALALFASLLSCGRDLTGPGGRGSLVALQLAPDFSAMVDSVDGVAYSVADLVPFTRVRIELRRLDNTVAASQVVDFPSDATELPLSIRVRLGDGALNGAEPLTAFLRYINASGDTVFAGGPVSVTAQAGRDQDPPVSIPIAPTVPGAVFASVDISPDSAEGNSGTSLTFTATGFDEQNAVVSNAIIGFLSRNPAVASVPVLGEGTVNLVGARGETWIVAQSLTGLRDSAHVRVLPVPSQIVKVSGDGQTALQGLAFAQPLQVRVLASDNLPVAGATVTFTVASGGGSVSAASAQTDANGDVSVLWTAGTELGAGSVTASVGTPAITTTFTGSQVNAGPTSLAFETEPVNITAGDTLPPIRVAVRNALDQPITSFTGVVSLTRVGTGGGQLIGDTAVAAVAGVATFSGLTVDRPGTDYRLVAVLTGVPNQLSSVFTVAAAPPHVLQLVSGGGQTTDPSTALPAPIVVRVLDIFANPVVGTTVNFTVQSGGGSVTPTSVTTDANGQASTQWTVGAAGLQILRATASPAPVLDVAAQLSVAGGPATLFAGYDSTLVRIGFERSLPVYLSSNSDTAITATLSTNAPGLQWAAPTATFAPFTRRTDVALAAADSLLPGTYWAYVSSAIGSDSIEITVDSSFVMFVSPYYVDVHPGDTVHLPVRVPEPAPPGGITVRVTSLDTAYARVLRGTGGGHVTPGCLNPEYCWVGNIVTTEGTPADSVDLLIPEGEMMAHAAMVVTTPPGQSFLTVPLQVTAPKHRAGSVSFVSAGDLPFFTGQVDTIGVGLAATTALTTNQTSAARDRVFQVRSLAPAIFSVDSLVVIPRLQRNSPNFDIRGLAAGTGALEYGNAQLGYDTITVTVVQPQLRFINNFLNGPVASTRSTFLYLEAPGNTAFMQPLADVPVTLTSLDPLVATAEPSTVTVPGGEFETAVLVRFVGAGATQIVATAPGFGPDTMFATGDNLGISVNTGGGAVAVGTAMTWTASILGRSGDVGGPRRIAIQPRNPALARVVVADQDIARVGSGLASFQVVGLAPGADSADVLLDGAFVRSVPYVVSPSQLRLQTSGVQTIDPDSTFTWTLPAFLTDSVGFTRLAVDTVRGVLRSNDPSVVLVTDSTLTINPGQPAFAASVRIVGVQPGTAIITLSSPGYADVVDTVTVRAPALAATLGNGGGVGLGLAQHAQIVRNSSTTAALPVTVTHQGPGRVAFLNAPLEFPAGEDLLFEYVEGVTEGVDTVIVGAVGHTPDTLVFTVVASRAHLQLDQVVSNGFTDDFVFVRLSFGESNTFEVSATDRRFVLTSTDTTKAKILQDTIVVPGFTATALRAAVVRYTDAGTVSLVMTDLDAVLGPDTVEVTIAPSRLTGWTEWEQNYMPLGMRQRSYADNMFVELDYDVVQDTWVRLTPSRPGLITLPDSVLIPAGWSYGTFDVAAGDTVGTVRVTASIPGVTPWEFDIAVTRSKLEVCGCGGYVGADNSVEVYLVDGLEEYARPVHVASTITVTSESPSTATIAQAEVTMPAGAVYFAPRVLRGLAPGRALVRATDSRGDVFSAFESGWSHSDIRQPTMNTINTRYFAAPGLENSRTDHFVQASAIRDTIAVHVASALGRMVPTEDTLRIIDQNFEFDSRLMAITRSSTTPFRLRGISAGEDTLIFTAPGLPTHRVPVSVEPGILQLDANTPSVISVGDSVLVRVNFATPDGQLGATTADSVTLNFGFMDAPGLRLAPSVVNAVDQSAVIPPGATFATFWVRADLAGFGTFEINSPSFRTLRITFEARTRP